MLDTLRASSSSNESTVCGAVQCGVYGERGRETRSRMTGGGRNPMFSSTVPTCACVNARNRSRNAQM